MTAHLIGYALLGSLGVGFGGILVWAFGWKVTATAFGIVAAILVVLLAGLALVMVPA